MRQISVAEFVRVKIKVLKEVLTCVCDVGATEIENAIQLMKKGSLTHTHTHTNKYDTR